jgi:hypothetical protein
MTSATTCVQQAGSTYFLLKLLYEFAHAEEKEAR